MKIGTRKHGLLLVGSAIFISAAFVVVSSFRDLTALENTLLQVFSMGLGLLGSFVVGREGSKQAAIDLIKPHAKSAFRRLLSLYNSLSRLAGAIESQKDQLASNKTALHALEKLQGIVIEQISTADDALEDWKDIIPEELDKLKTSARRGLALEAKNE